LPNGTLSTLLKHDINNTPNFNKFEPMIEKWYKSRKINNKSYRNPPKYNDAWSRV
jgi:hypothetical protein